MIILSVHYFSTKVGTYLDSVHAHAPVFLIGLIFHINLDQYPQLSNSTD